MIQKVSPSAPSHTGVTRGRPVRRPIVSRSASPGGGIRSAKASLSSGLITIFWSRSRRRRRAAAQSLSARPDGSSAGTPLMAGLPRGSPRLLASPPSAPGSSAPRVLSPVAGASRRRTLRPPAPAAHRERLDGEPTRPTGGTEDHGGPSSGGTLPPP